MWTTKAQISLRIHRVLSVLLLFTAWIVLYLYLLRPKFQDPHQLSRPVWVSPGRTPGRQVFSWRGSNVNLCYSGFLETVKFSSSAEPTLIFSFLFFLRLHCIFCSQPLKSNANITIIIRVLDKHWDWMDFLKMVHGTSEWDVIWK